MFLNPVTQKQPIKTSNNDNKMKVENIFPDGEEIVFSYLGNGNF